MVAAAPRLPCPADADRPHPRRSLILLAIGAATGFCLAVAGLAGQQRPAADAVPPEDVALVNGRPILRSDLAAQVEAVYAAPEARSTPAQRKAVLQAMIREELLVQKGLRIEAAEYAPEVRAALFTAMEQRAIAEAVSTRPGEAELQAYYAARPAAYQTYGVMRLLNLVPERPAGDAGEALRQGQAAAQALRSGRPQAEVRRAFHLKEGAGGEEELFYITQNLRLGPRLFGLALAMRASEARAVMQPDGVHVLAMLKNQPPSRMDYASVRETVASDYQRGQQAALEDAEIAFLKRRADIRFAPAYGG